MTTDKLLTAREAAEILRVTPQTVKGYCTKGLLRASKPRYDWLIRQSDLGEFIRKGEPK